MRGVYFGRCFSGQLLAPYVPSSVRKIIEWVLRFAGTNLRPPVSNVTRELFGENRYV